MEHAQNLPQPAPQALTEEQVDTLIDILARDPGRLAQVIAQAGPEDVRGDGWTPPRRQLFLSVLADTGRIKEACYWASMSKQSAYALRARDPLFAAGWDAACEIARNQLADTLYEKAIDGVTDTVTRDGEIVAERHRFDSRLSIAVLHRLDKRCDRASEHGARHLPAVANWDQFLAHIGSGDEAAAQQLLQTAAQGQASQLPLGESPTDADEQDPDAPEEIDCYDRCWQDDEGNWMTNFPPPPDFDGYRIGEWGNHRYERACTPEEIAVLEVREAADSAEDLAEDEQLRDDWFAALRAEVVGDEQDQQEEEENRPGPQTKSPNKSSSQQPGPNPADAA